jgi:hypothetical protein
MPPIRVVLSARAMNVKAALAYVDVPFSRGIVLGFFATYLIPQGVLFVPLVRMLRSLRLTDSVLSLIVTYPGLVIPFGTWVLWSFFNSLPRDLIENARIEGAGVVAVLRWVLRPLAWPALAAVVEEVVEHDRHREDAGAGEGVDGSVAEHLPEGREARQVGEVGKTDKGPIAPDPCRADAEPAFQEERVPDDAKGEGRRRQHEQDCEGDPAGFPAGARERPAAHQPLTAPAVIPATK